MKSNQMAWHESILTRPRLDKIRKLFRELEDDVLDAYSDKEVDVREMDSILQWITKLETKMLDELRRGPKP